MIFLLIICCFGVNAECNHNFDRATDESNVFSVSESTHSYYCLNGCGNYGTSDGGINTEESCSYILVSEKESNCISTGKNIFMCSVCYRHKEVITPVSGHKYRKIRRLPTCTQAGYDLVYCTVCNKSSREKFTEPLKHLSDGGVIEIQPTYNGEGVIRYSCRVCNCIIDRKSVSKLFKLSENHTSAVSGFKVKDFGSSYIKLSWNQYADSVSYRVFYSTDKKEWKSITTEKTYLKINKLKPSKKYYFKVIAVGVNWQGQEGKILTAYTKPEKTVFTKVKSNKKSCASLEWKKLKNISGYEISYSQYSFSENKRIKTVNISKETELTLKKLKSRKKYFFRVRAYKKFGSTKLYSAYSKVKTLKIK